MAKAQAWTKESTAQLVSAYVEAGKDNEQLEVIAKEMGKTVPAVRSKLVSLGEYEKPAVARKVGGASAVRKMALVREIQNRTGIENLESLEKASKAHLQALVDALPEVAE